VSQTASRALLLAFNQMAHDTAAQHTTECTKLRERSVTGAAYFVEAAWQPSLSAVDSHVQACALRFALPLGVRTCSTVQGARKWLADQSWNDTLWSSSGNSATPPPPSGISQQRMRCPVRVGGPGANARAEDEAPAIVLRSQCISAVAGYTPAYVEPPWRFGSESGSMGQIERPRTAFSFESREWLKPTTCAMLSTPLMDPETRQEQARVALIKHVNVKARVEFRPVLKVATTFFGALLPCLQV